MCWRWWLGWRAALQVGVQPLIWQQGAPQASSYLNNSYQAKAARRKKVAKALAGKAAKRAARLAKEDGTLLGVLAVTAVEGDADQEQQQQPGQLSLVDAFELAPLEEQQALAQHLAGSLHGVRLLLGALGVHQARQAPGAKFECPCEALQTWNKH